AAELMTSAREPTTDARCVPSTVERRSRSAAPFEVQDEASGDVLPAGLFVELVPRAVAPVLPLRPNTRNLTGVGEGMGLDRPEIDDPGGFVRHLPSSCFARFPS